MRKNLIKIIILIAVVCIIFSACGTVNNDINEPVNIHTHLFVEDITINNPTCTDIGLKEAYCACGEKQTIVLDSLGHDFIPHDASPADCTHAGWREYRTCSRCDYSDYSQIPALGHDYGNWVVINEATCKEKGEETRVCLRDETHYETRDLQPSGHKPGDWSVVKKPDCESDGLQIKKCEVCSNELEREILPATGHEFGEWELISEPTCIKEGVLVRICKKDNRHTETRETEAIAHNYKWQADVDSHMGVCEECKNTTESAPHEWLNGICSVCGYVKVSAPELNFVLSGDISYSVSGIGSVTQTDIIIPSEYNGLPVTAIESGAFCDCGSITSVFIPDNVISIGEGAFVNCDNLTSVIFENPEGWSVYKNDIWQGDVTQLSDGVTALKRLRLYSGYTWKRI